MKDRAAEIDPGVVSSKGPAPSEPTAVSSRGNNAKRSTSLFRSWLEVMRTGNPPDLVEPDMVTKWLVATRAAVQPMTLTSALLAGSAAIRSDGFNWRLYLLACVGLVAAHAANNIMNDLFDLRAGSDTYSYPRALYAPHPVLSGMMSKSSLITAAVLLNGIDLVVLLALWRARGWPVVAFAVAGFVLSVAYTAPPFRLKRIGLGELAVFAVWGPLMTAGTYYAGVGRLSWRVWAFSVPYGLLATAVLMGKHIDKIPWDSRLGVRTLPVILGEARARILTRVLVWSVYPLLVAGIGIGVFPIPALVTLAGIPTATKVDRVLRRARPESPPDGFPVWPLWFAAWTFLHTRRAGALLVGGCLAGAALIPTRLA